MNRQPVALNGERDGNRDDGRPDPAPSTYWDLDLLLSGAENAYGFGLSAALVVPMGSAGEAGW
jgi:hypothetical protein